MLPEAALLATIRAYHLREGVGSMRAERVLTLAVPALALAACITVVQAPPTSVPSASSRSSLPAPPAATRSAAEAQVMPGTQRS